MTLAMRLHLLQDDDWQLVTDWRLRRLAAAGFPRPLAVRLAEDHRYDLHEMLMLVDRGCPPELAARILAPDQAR